MRRAFTVALIVVGLGVLVGVAAALLSADLTWRLRVLAYKARGDLPELPLSNLIQWLRPGSPVYLGGLARSESPNLHAQIRNSFIDTSSERIGEELFRKRCVACHDGGHGANDLMSAVGGRSDWYFFSTVKWGQPRAGMGAQPLSDVEIWQVHSYLRFKSLGQARDSVGLDPAKKRKIHVAPEAISNARPTEDWLTYGGNYAAHRHSHLGQIAVGNVHALALKWAAYLRRRSTPAQSSPIVANGVMFVTESEEGVVAFDARTGRKIWQYRRAVPDNLPLCCGTPNRGAAILGDKLFFTTLDNHLVALEAATGHLRWIRKVVDYKDGYTMTGAPLALKDRVVIGVAGGEHGIRGFVAAFQAADGVPLWRFNTIPSPGEPGSETWSGDAWKTGGAPTWTVGSYDEKRNLLFWGTGNPGPDFQADARPGDNLYSNCLIALDAESGKLVWHFQFNPADEYDWDSVQQPVLAEIDWRGKTTSVVFLANKNGFFYALDRETGAFLFAKPFAKQTWLAGFEQSGRPIKRPNVRPSERGTLVSPSAGGAANWWPLSYDRRRQLVYVPSVDAAGLFFRGEAKFEKGKMFWGSTWQYAANLPTAAAIRAIDARTGEVKWQVLLEKGGENVSRVVGGVMSTEGGVFFSGYKEEFAAYDSNTGRKLWSVNLGARVSGPPVAFGVGGDQRIAVAAGSSVFVFGLP